MNPFPLQVIVNRAGNSWLGTYVSNNKMNEALNHILYLSESDTYKAGEWANSFWLFDNKGGCVAAQSSLNGAKKYYRDGMILVHYQKTFV